MSSPENRTQLLQSHKDNRALCLKVSKLEKELTSAIDRQGVLLSEELSKDLADVVAEAKVPSDSFIEIIWQAFIDDLMVFVPKAPISKAYETLRQSGCVHLPSQRTLQDYSIAGAGFSDNVVQQLLKSIKSSSSTDKLFILLNS